MKPDPKSAQSISFPQSIWAFLDQYVTDVPCAALAVSGGMDSVALAAACAWYRDEVRPGLIWHLCHVHHGLRGAAADEDAAFCESLARRLGMPFHGARVNVMARATISGEGIEGAARALRYDALHAMCREHACKHLLLAHHAEDQAETVVMNLLRGAGALGAAGMPMCLDGEPVRVRPLLQTRRAELQAFCHAHALTWREDASNDEDIFRRNWVRHYFLPSFDAMHFSTSEKPLTHACGVRQTKARFHKKVATPNAHALATPDAMVTPDTLTTLDAVTAMGRLAQSAARLWAWREPRVQELLSRCVQINAIESEYGMRTLSVTALRALSDVDARDVLWVYFREHVGMAFSEKTVLRALAFMRQATSDKMLQLPGEWRWIRIFDVFILRHESVDSAQKELQRTYDLLHSSHQNGDVNNSYEQKGVPVEANAFCDICDMDDFPCVYDGLRLDVMNQTHVENDVFDASDMTMTADLDTLSFPLKLRRLKAGDRFQPLGAPGSKRVVDLLRERRVPVEERTQVMVLADAVGIVWVVGHRMAERVRVHHDTVRMMRCFASSTAHTCRVKN